MSFIVHARCFNVVNILVLDASADVDTLMQESEQGTVLIEAVFCGLCLKLGEFHCIYIYSCSHMSFYITYSSI